MLTVLRRIFVILMSAFLIIIFVVGIGIVDNAVRQAQNNPFLNGIYVDSDNYILCLRYLGAVVKIPYGIKGVLNSAISFLKPLVISVLMLFSKLKSIVFDIFLN